MLRRAAIFGFAALLCGTLGCAATPGPIFPELNPPLVWPPAPDTPRIQYIGELRGEASLKAPDRGWAAVQAVLTGPRAKVAFLRPSAVAVLGERIFVSDTGLGAVHELNLTTREYALHSGATDTPFLVPIDVVCLARDRVAVVDRKQDAVTILDGAGAAPTVYRWDAVQAPVSAAYDPQADALWIADATAHACHLVQLGGAVLRTITGSGPLQLSFPTGVAWSAQLGLIVADAMNFRIQLFSPDGTPYLTFGQLGDAAGSFALPRDVAVDSAGHIYVLDNRFENVQVFDAAGQLLMVLGESGSGPGQFSLPSGITIDAQDRIWIADSFNQRVQVFQYLGGAEG